MQFFCPQCQTPMTTAGGISHVICPSCGLEINLELVDTNAGRPHLQLATDHTGTQIGPYLLQQCLGTGGMGSVYRATDTRNDGAVAVKVLYPQLAALPHVLTRFHREAQALEKLQHAGIVRFIEAGSAEGRHYIAMCYVAGEDLGKLIARQQLDIPTALSVTQQVGEALAAAHAKGIVHRDLKPANVMVTPTGHVQVLDFGIAQFATQDHTLTHTNAVLGTFNFMSPEQRQGAKDVDHRCDLYALGAMLYLMLTGTLPIGVLEPPRRLNRAIDRQLERLVLGLLHNDPAKRPQSATEVVHTLQAIQAPSSRRWTTWAAAAVLAAGLGAAGVYITRVQDKPAVKGLGTPGTQDHAQFMKTTPTKRVPGERSPANAQQRLSGDSPKATPAPDAQAPKDAGPDAKPTPPPRRVPKLRVTKTFSKGKTKPRTVKGKPALDRPKTNPLPPPSSKQKNPIQNEALPQLAK